VSKKNPRHVTFASLDETQGVVLPPAPPGGEYPLPAWYRSVREIPLDDFSVEDTCKACRQNVHLEHIVPRALRLLEIDPLAGEMYEGELLVSLASIPVQYWSGHEVERLSLKSIINAALDSEEIAENVRHAATELYAKLA
jgi:hypothetical protein